MQPRVGKFVVIACAGLAFSVSACGAMHASKPLPKGMLAAEASLGGAFFDNLGAPIPVPIAAVGARYGLSDQIDIDGHLDATAAGFGAAAIDFGAAFTVLDPNETSFVYPIVAPRFTVGYGGGVFRIYPELALIMSHPFDWWWAYYGLDAFFDFVAPTDTLPASLTAFVGAGIELDDEGFWGLSAELRWFSFNHSTEYGTVSFLSIADHGSFGAMLGVQRWFEVNQ